MLEKMVFEKILIEHSLHEQAGRDFWVKYFLTQVRFVIYNCELPGKIANIPLILVTDQGRMD